MPDNRTNHKTLPFSGKLMTGEPASIGQNFRTLKNLRYTDTHVKGVAGMTKITSAVLDATYLKARNAFHFKKSQPAETHVLAQAYNTGLTASQVLENKTAIPSAGNFEATELLADGSGAGRGRFSDAPDGQIIYANGVDNCIWGGNEMKVGAFITSTAAVTTAGATDPKDYTEAINNTKQDGDNVARIGGGIDAYTVLMLHMDEADGGTDFTDSSASAHVTTAVGNAQCDTDQAKFGVSSGLFDGTTAYVTVGDHADFDLSGGIFKIEAWVRPTIGAIQYIYSQYTDADNTFGLFINAAGNVGFQIITGGVSKVLLLSTSGTLTSNVWAHVALVESGDSWYLFIDGVLVDSDTDTDRALNYTGLVHIGVYYNGTSYSNYLNANIDELRISKGIARQTTTHTPPTRPYSADSKTWLVGSPRPLQGLKYYISKVNTLAGTMTGSFWNGNSWETLTLTDNTDTGASLAQTGTVTFATTVSTAKPKYLEGYFLYWYQFALDAGDAEVYHVTLDAPLQGIVDMWDGIFRDVARFYKYTTVYLDNTLNVFRDDYDASSAITYSNLSELGAFSDPNNCLEVGFFEKMTGLKIDVAPEYTHSTAATTMVIDYWNGEDYVSAGVITDGTSEGAISLAKSGVVTWNNNALSDETFKVVSNSPPLYYYRVRFDKEMDATVRVNYVGGLTAQKAISHYKFSVFAQGRILLCGDMSEEKNKVLCSAKYMPQTYNGSDSVYVYFGESGELTCGTELFSQFGSSLYSLVLMFKDNEMWVMAGQDISQWDDNIFLLSSTIGCPAPLTLKTINLHAEPGTGINRALAIWQGANGVFMSDGRAPIPIHGDIKAYFDPLDSRLIKASMVGDSIGFIDPARQEYHLLIASGSGATTLNTELVYDIARNKWFEIDRTAALDLQCGVTVHDTDGNGYAYGFVDTGYMERLEYGTDFDGVDIVHTVQFGDMPMEDLATETRVSALKLLTAAKTVTDQDVTLTHYADTGTVETAVAAVGTITMTGIATANETFVIDTQTFTWKAARVVAGEVTIGATGAAACDNIKAAVNADLDTVTAADGAGDTLTITADIAGVLGNRIVFTEDSTNMAMNGGGVLGGTTPGAYATAVAKTMSPIRTGFRLAAPELTEKLDGDPFHSFKLTTTTDDEVTGFEPLALVVAYHPTHKVS